MANKMVRVSENNLTRLAALAGIMQSQTGLPKSNNDALSLLLSVFENTYQTKLDTLPAPEGAQAVPVVTVAKKG